MHVVANHAHGDTAVEPHGGHSGATVRQYVQIFVVLFVVTLLEVGASFLSDIGVPVWGEIAVLIALAVLKGALVVLFYMHLRFDSNWFRFLFTAAMILATFGVGVFIVLFTYRAGLVD